MPNDSLPFPGGVPQVALVDCGCPKPVDGSYCVGDKTYIVPGASGDPCAVPPVPPYQLNTSDVPGTAPNCIALID